MEDLIEQMKSRDIVIAALETDNGAVSRILRICCRIGCGAGAQLAYTRTLADRFVDEKTAKPILDPANLPDRPESKGLTGMIFIGLIAGVLAGGLFALIKGLKVWKLAAGLGIAGAVLGAATAFAIPDRYRSMEVIRVIGSSRMPQSILTATSDASLDEIVTKFGLYPNDPAARK